MFKATARLIDVFKKVRKTKVRGNRLYNDGTVHGSMYLTTCIECKKHGVTFNYIGETGRELSIRIKEHCRQIDINKVNDNSVSAIALYSVRTHVKQPSNKQWVFEPIDRCNSTQNVKSLEALHIHVLKPTLNRDAGVQIILRNNTISWKSSEKRKKMSTF